MAMAGWLLQFVLPLFTMEVNIRFIYIAANP